MLQTIRHIGWLVARVTPGTYGFDLARIPGVIGHGSRMSERGDCGQVIAEEPGA
jgi:hypothetical protein